MPPKKTPLAERDANATSRKPASKQADGNDRAKNRSTPQEPSLYDVANRITSTHGKKRSHEESNAPQAAMPTPITIAPTSGLPEHLPGVDPSEGFSIHYTCNQVRSKLRALVNSGEFKVGQLHDGLGVSGNSYRNFMTTSGTMGGADSDTYHAAHQYLAHREAQGQKTPRAKKAKTSSANEDTTNTSSNSTSTARKNADKDKFDVSGITLPGEDAGAVPIYDTCDDLRTKINAHLRQPGTSQAALGRAMSETYAIAHDTTTSINGAQISRFLQKKGPTSGATSPVYYAAYVYFEKLRVKQKKPKSKKREEMEKVHGEKGASTEVDGNSRFTLCMANERMVEDKYGKMSFVKIGP